MNIPKIKFLAIRFLRIALKSQNSLAAVVLQNRQEIDLLIPEQRGIWAILNETCCFWVNTFSEVKESLTVLKKSIQLLQNLKEWAGEVLWWLQSLFGGFFWWWEIWIWPMPLLIPVITILMLLMIAPCIINCLNHFVSAQANKLQHVVPVQKGYIKLQLTTENITHT